MHSNAYKQRLLCNTEPSVMLKFIIRYKNVCARWAVILKLIYGDGASAEYEITNISFGLGDGCLFFMAATRRLEQQGETSRLREAVRKLSGLCLVGSWRTATNSTD